jgi:flagellar protein FliS
MMMMPTNKNPYASQQYKQQQVQTASKEQLLLMLFDGAIKFSRQGQQAMEANQREEAHNKLLKAQKIITELMGCLRPEENPEVAKSLFSLYEYLHHQLVQANLKQQAALVEEVIGHLATLRQTWQEAILLAKKELAQEQPAQQAAEAPSLVAPLPSPEPA